MSPVARPGDQLLLTQKLQLPSARDEELSQFTESDVCSVGSIEGVRPIEDTPSEASEASYRENDVKYGTLKILTLVVNHVDEDVSLNVLCISVYPQCY